LEKSYSFLIGGSNTFLIPALWLGGLKSTMDDCETSRLRTVTEKYEPLFLAGMIGIVQLGVLVQKGCLRFFERHAVFHQVGSGFANIAIKYPGANPILLTALF
jgi:hypothetical protein